MGPEVPHCAGEDRWDAGQGAISGLFFGVLPQRVGVLVMKTVFLDFFLAGAQEQSVTRKGLEHTTVCKVIR